MCKKPYEVSSMVYYGWVHYCEKADKPMYSNGILQSTSFKEITLITRGSHATKPNRAS